MNNYREMYEALLKGETLTYADREIRMNDDGRVYATDIQSTVNVEILTPAKWQIKPRIININGFQVLEPIREPLEEGESFYLTDMYRDSGYVILKWENTEHRNFLLSKGMLHGTEEAAQLHAKALWSFTAKGDVSNETIS